MRSSFKALPVSLLLLASSLVLAVQFAAPVAAATPVQRNFVDCGVTNYNFYCLVPVHAKGDTLILTAALLDESSSVTSGPRVSSVSDNMSNGWQLDSQIFQSSGGANCSDLSVCEGASVWSATAQSAGNANVLIDFSDSGSYPDEQYTIAIWDFSGIGSTPIGAAATACQASTEYCSGTGSIGTGISLVEPSQSVAIAAIQPPGAMSNIGFSFGLGTGCPAFCDNGGWGVGVGTAESPQNFTFSGGSKAAPWALAGAVFGPSGLFTCSITNMVADNYVIAGNGQYYNLACEVQSSAISATASSPISDLKVEYNDSNTGSCSVTCFSTNMPNVVIYEYNNGTKAGTTSVDEGGGITTLGTANVSQSYSGGIREMNVTFPFQLNDNAVTALERGIQLYASLANGDSKGFTYVQKDYFNILTSGNGGGATSKLDIDGLCSVPSGADVFQTICQYGSNSHNWIAENATYYQLQQYQGQFSIATLNQYGEPTPAFWQNYPNSGSGTNPSSNPGDWTIDSGLYSWDNTSATCCWVKTIHVTLSMLEGRVGSSNLWTAFQALWYDGSSLIANNTFYAFVPTDSPNTSGASSVAIWLNFWYSQNNGSTYLGGEVGAYYTGMHNVGSIFGSNWSPFLGNYSNSQVFVPLDDHSGDLMPAEQAQMSTVYMNMSRPGAPSQHTNQANFEIETTNFQEQEFNVASAGMTGIATPTFAAAVVPTVQSNSIFSPIINAIKSIASFVAKAFVALGTIVWNGLAARFPWFTNFWAGVGGAVYQFALQFEQVIIYVLDALQVFAKGLSFLGTIFGTLTSAYGTISSAYTSVFKGQSLQEMILIIVLLVFVGDIMNAAERGDTMHFVHLAQGAWGIAQTVMWWTYLFVKFIIDSIEGIIP